MTPISVFSVVGERLRQGIARRRGRGRMAAAAALAASTAGPALAQSGDSVQIYGFIKEDVETIRLSGNGRTESLTRLANDLSVLGLRGQERISADLEAFFQIETNLRMTGAGPAEISDRNSGLGCAALRRVPDGAMGNAAAVRLGLYGGPVHGGRVRVELHHGQWLHNGRRWRGAALVRSAPEEPFQYTTPNWRGFSLKAGVTLPSRMPTGNPMMASGLASFASGDWFVAWGTSTTATTSTTAPRTTPTAWRRPTPLAAPNYAAPTSACAISPRRDGRCIATPGRWPSPMALVRINCARRIPAAAMRAGTRSPVGGIGLPGPGSSAWQLAGLRLHAVQAHRALDLVHATREWLGRPLQPGRQPLPQLRAGDTATAFGAGITHRF